MGPSPPEPELQKLPPEAGVAVPCLLELCKQVLPEQAERAAPASPSLGFAGHPEKLGDMGQGEVKVCASPVSSAIDPAGFFLGGGEESALFSLLNLALPQRENTCSLHPVCKEGVQLLEVARLENWDDVIFKK